MDVSSEQKFYIGLVKVGESADGGDNYGISNQLGYLQFLKEKSIATIVYNKMDILNIVKTRVSRMVTEKKSSLGRC
jgi:hypothetical protein